MAVDQELLEILACPLCKEEVKLVPLAEARRALEHFVRTAPSPRFDKDKATARRALQFMPGR